VSVVPFVVSVVVFVMSAQRSRRCVPTTHHYPALPHPWNPTRAELARSVQEAVEERLDELRRKPSAKRPRADDAASVETRVHADGQRCVQIADEKVALAQRCYDLVDQHIMRLDKDLRAFDAALVEREAAAAAEGGDAGAAAGGGGAPSANALAQLMEQQKARGGGAPSAEAGAGVAAGVSIFGEGVPVDPNEPVYCSCQRISFGEMIACENDDCAVEWFHFACVGLSVDAKIKGKWYCPTCTAERRRQKKLLAKGGK
jgi:hypothetical protein